MKILLRFEMYSSIYLVIVFEYVLGTQRLREKGNSLHYTCKGPVHRQDQ